MKTINIYVPEYYREFHCITSKCQHICCAGWEIDIDSDSLARYQHLTGDFGVRVNRNISCEGTPHFILTDHERCPMLNQNNLCDLILNEGEDALCQICRDHPRFRNYFSSRIEMGLGLACEEAARIILTWPKPFRLIRLEGDSTENPTENERYLFALRDEWLASISDEGPRSRIMETLIYRHLADALYDGQLEKRIAFIQRAYKFITDGWDDECLETLVERTRAFSDQVEYDDEILERWINKSE